LLRKYYYLENLKQYSLTNVKKVGWVEKDKWSELMDKAKVVVVPSIFYENCSMAILEALSYGRLVVATDRGGNPEMIKDGQTGFLAKPEDSESLARGVKTAMDTTEVQAMEMVKAGRALVENNHNPENYFNQLEEIYNQVLETKKSAKCGMSEALSRRGGICKVTTLSL